MLYAASVLVTEPRCNARSRTLRRIPLEGFSCSNPFTMVWRKNSIFHAQYLQLFDDFFAHDLAQSSALPRGKSREIADTNPPHS